MVRGGRDRGPRLQHLEPPGAADLRERGLRHAPAGGLGRAADGAPREERSRAAQRRLLRGALPCGACA
eukprot:10453884-Alexandrium_andersonii.AAC.1